MLKNISNLGTTLSTSQLKNIQGSGFISATEPGGECSAGNWCPAGQICRCDDNACTSGTCEYALER